MKIGLIIDLVLIGIIIFCAYRGFRTGLITSLVGIVAIVVAIYGANLIATTYSAEFTGIAEPFVSGLIDSAQAKILNYDPASGSDKPKEALKAGEESNVQKVTNSILRELGLSEEIAGDLADKVAKQESTVSASMSDTISKFLSERLCFIAAFVIGFALIMIITSAIGNMLDLVFGLPGLENINHILGGVLGAVKGIAIVLVITLMCRYMGMIIGDDIINDSFMLRSLVESNALASILNL